LFNALSNSLCCRGGDLLTNDGTQQSAESVAFWLELTGANAVDNLSQDGILGT
jgi:hypothetical protein